MDSYLTTGMQTAALQILFRVFTGQNEMGARYLPIRWAAMQATFYQKAIRRPSRPVRPPPRMPLSWIAFWATPAYDVQLILESDREA